MSSGWILCVDDDAKLLDALQLQLHLGLDLDVRIASSGAAGLDVLTAHPDCAVIISDMRMPEMNGAAFLAKAREQWPDTTRMLLTGYTDIDGAIAAVNTGGIFRFLTKPTSPEMVRGAVTDAIRQWELVRSERVLLEQTLHGAVAALIEALEISSPAAFSRARAVEETSRQVAVAVGLEPVWPTALAGLLYRLGWIAVPHDVVERHMRGDDLSGQETAMIEDGFAISARLVGRIPRLGEVAEIITDAAAGPGPEVSPAAVVRAAADLDRLCVLGDTPASAALNLKGRFAPQILEALVVASTVSADVVYSAVGVWELLDDMTVEQDIVSQEGTILVRSGAQLTTITIARLGNFAAAVGIAEPISVSQSTRRTG